MIASVKVKQEDKENNIYLVLCVVVVMKLINQETAHERSCFAFCISIF